MKFLRFCLLFLLFLRLISFFLSKPHFKIGDVVRISGVVTEIRYESAFETKTGARKAEIVINGDYVVKLDIRDDDQNLKYKKIVVVGEVGDQKIITAKNFQISPNGIWEDIQNFFDNIREKVKFTYFKYLPFEEAQIVTGIFLGDSKGISREMYDAFKKAGVLHLFAASGMNLVLFCGFWQEVLNLVVRRRRAVFFAILTSVFYVFLVGFSTSILRAGVMFSFASFGYVLGRPIRPISNLAKSAGFLLFLSPEMLVNLGFQLSVLSTLAIISLPSKFKIEKCGQTQGSAPTNININVGDDPRVVPKDLNNLTIQQFSNIIRLMFGSFWSVVHADFAVSTACFLFTAPLIILAFNQVNLLSPFANILVLWSIDIIMAFGGVMGLIAFFLPEIIATSLVKVLFFAIYPIILWFKWVVMEFSKLNVGVINVKEGAQIGSVLIFSLVIWTIFLINRQRKHEHNKGIVF